MEDVPIKEEYEDTSNENDNLYRSKDLDQEKNISIKKNKSPKSDDSKCSKNSYEDNLYDHYYKDLVVNPSSPMQNNSYVSDTIGTKITVFSNYKVTTSLNNSEVLKEKIEQIDKDAYNNKFMNKKRKIKKSKFFNGGMVFKGWNLVDSITLEPFNDLN